MKFFAVAVVLRAVPGVSGRGGEALFRSDGSSFKERGRKACAGKSAAAGESFARMFRQGSDFPA